MFSGRDNVTESVNGSYDSACHIIFKLGHCGLADHRAGDTCLELNGIKHAIAAHKREICDGHKVV